MFMPSGMHWPAAPLQPIDETRMPLLHFRSGLNLLPAPSPRSGIAAIRKFATVMLLATLGVTAGCGFQMRGSSSLPFETLYIPGSSTMGVELKRNIAAGTGTRPVNTPEDAQAQVVFTQDVREKVILSLNTAGRVREFQLRHRVGFRVVDNRGREYLPLNEIVLTRDVSFNDAQLLAKEAEETLLYRDMQTDMVQQILRRLSGARMPTNESTAPGTSGSNAPGSPAVAAPVAPTLGATNAPAASTATR
jgi:LPS-assembly lipoprotein